MIADREGALVLGFVSEDIFYMRFIGRISTSLASKSAALLRKHLADSRILGCFCDADTPETVDLAVRSEIIRAFLDNRRRLESTATLVGTPAVASTVRAIATVLDCLVHVVENTDEFNTMLVRAAPYARAKLPRDKWARTVLSELPGRRSTRMRVAPRRS